MKNLQLTLLEGIYGTKTIYQQGFGQTTVVVRNCTRLSDPGISLNYKVAGMKKWAGPLLVLALPTVPQYGGQKYFLITFLTINPSGESGRVEILPILSEEYYRWLSFIHSLHSSVNSSRRATGKYWSFCQSWSPSTGAAPPSWPSPTTASTDYSKLKLDMAIMASLSHTYRKLK